MSARKIMMALCVTSVISVFSLSYAGNVAATSPTSASVLEGAQTLVQTRSAQIQQKILAQAKRHSNSRINYHKLAQIFANGYENPIMTAVQFQFLNNTPQTFVLAGSWACYGPPNKNYPQDPDGTMSEMWVRDAAAQLHAYLPIFTDKTQRYPATQVNDLKLILQGFIQNSSTFLAAHPMAHAFLPDGSVDSAGQDYELDTPAYFIWFAYDFWQATGDTKQFDSNFKTALTEIMANIQKGQRQNLDTGDALNYTGMSWSYTRPSDDPLLLPFNVPDNMLVAVAMQYASEIATKVYGDTGLANQAKRLHAQVVNGINQYAIINHYQYGKMFAFEVDGTGKAQSNTFRGNGQKTSFTLNFTPFEQSGTTFNDPAKSIEVSRITHGRQQILHPGVDYTVAGNTLTLTQAPNRDQQIQVRGNFVLMDDANLPSLLSAPYFRYVDADNEIYQATRSFVLSRDNPYYFRGISNDQLFAGIGSSHTESEIATDIWPLALIAQGITSVDSDEQNQLLNMIINSAVNADPQQLPTYGCSSSQAETKVADYPAGNYMHESFDVNVPTQYTRGWFPWPNALLGEWMDNMMTKGSQNENNFNALVEQSNQKIK